jgi:hypothetical protein
MFPNVPVERCPRIVEQIARAVHLIVHCSQLRQGEDGNHIK